MEEGAKETGDKGNWRQRKLETKETGGKEEGEIEQQTKEEKENGGM